MNVYLPSMYNGMYAYDSCYASLMSGVRTVTVLMKTVRPWVRIDGRITGQLQHSSTSLPSLSRRATNSLASSSVFAASCITSSRTASRTAAGILFAELAVQ